MLLYHCYRFLFTGFVIAFSPPPAPPPIDFVAQLEVLCCCCCCCSCRPLKLRDMLCMWYLCTQIAHVSDCLAASGPFTVEWESSGGSSLIKWTVSSSEHGSLVFILTPSNTWLLTQKTYNTHIWPDCLPKSRLWQRVCLCVCVSMDFSFHSEVCKILKQRCS